SFPTRRSSDLRVDRPGLQLARPLPDIAQELLAGLDPADARHEGLEEAELQGGQVDLLTVDEHAVRLGVEADRSHLLARRRLAGDAPAKDGFYPQHHLTHREGLGDVVVRAPFENDAAT